MKNSASNSQKFIANLVALINESQGKIDRLEEDLAKENRKMTMLKKTHAEYVKLSDEPIEELDDGSYVAEFEFKAKLDEVKEDFEPEDSWMNRVEFILNVISEGTAEEISQCMSYLIYGKPEKFQLKIAGVRQALNVLQSDKYDNRVTGYRKNNRIYYHLR